MINIFNKFITYNKMTENNIGIIGYGEIGQALDSIYKSNNFSTLLIDPYKNLNEDISTCDIINIAIPFYDYISFSKNLLELKIKDNAIIIIHSSIEIGTTNKIQKLLKNNIIIASPVRGIHPNLVEGLLTFNKYIGISETFLNNEILIDTLKSHFNKLNINITICKSEEAELAKIVSTTIYGVLISLTEDIGKICDYHNLDFENVFTNWQKTYNEGYIKLKKPEFVRPILKRIPNKSKVIGGHCVIPNAIILSKIEPHIITQNISNFVLRYSNKKNIIHKAKEIGKNNDDIHNED